MQVTEKSTCTKYEKWTEKESLGERYKPEQKHTEKERREWERN